MNNSIFKIFQSGNHENFKQISSKIFFFAFQNLKVQILIVLEKA